MMVIKEEVVKNVRPRRHATVQWAQNSQLPFTTHLCSCLSLLRFQTAVSDTTRSNNENKTEAIQDSRFHKGKASPGAMHVRHEEGNTQLPTAVYPGFFGKTGKSLTNMQCVIIAEMDSLLLQSVLTGRQVPDLISQTLTKSEAGTSVQGGSVPHRLCFVACLSYVLQIVC